MIRGGYFYPDKQWKRKPHANEITGEYAGDCLLNFVVGNRRAGKTVGVGIFAIADYLIYGYRTALIRRYDKDFTNAKSPAQENFWRKAWAYREEFIEIVKSDEKLQELYPLDVLEKVDFMDHELTFAACHALIDGDVFCYPVMLNQYDANKQNNFDNVRLLIYDEFIPETVSVSLPCELSRVLNVYDTVARGRKNAFKTTGVILMSNAVTANNNFYSELKISRELRDDTKFLARPEKGYCLEVVHNTVSETETLESPFGKLLQATEAGRAYLGYSQGNAYQDDDTFIQQLHGQMRYIANFKFDGGTYALKLHQDSGLYYFTDDGVDKDYAVSYALTRDDHDLSTTLITTPIRKVLTFYRSHYDQALMRFNSQKSKQAFMDIYHML